MSNLVIPNNGTIGSAGDTDAISISSSGAVTLSSDFVPATPLSHRNMIINGGMQVWQRATSATTASQDYHTADRWKMYESTDGAYTSEKHDMSLAECSTTGHRTALKLTPTTADPDIEPTQYAYTGQFIEAQNLQHLKYGTADAKTITLSFWVKSNITGTWCIHLRKPDNTAYNYIKNYSISSADTWEHKTITITPTAGSTSLITGANGAIDNNNDVGLIVGFNLGWGSNGHGADDTWNSSDDYGTSSHSTTASFMANTSNTFYLTGVQLELGSVATPFEMRSYGEELARCQRYYYKIDTYRNNGYGSLLMMTSHNQTQLRGHLELPQVMRTLPTFVADGNFQTVADKGGTLLHSDFAVADTGGNPSYQIRYDVSNGGTPFTEGKAYMVRGKNDIDAYFEFKAEL